MTVIGLVGKAHAGKDTLAERLVERHGFTRVAFADALKQAALRTDPLIPLMKSDAYRVRLSKLVLIRGWDAAKANPEVRRYLQAYGMAIREVSPGFWVDVVRYKIASDISARWVVTDVRFADEMAMIHSFPDSWIVRVVRPGHDNGLGANGEHPSETSLDDIKANLVVTNSGTLEDLHEIADNVAAVLV